LQESTPELSGFGGGCLFGLGGVSSGYGFQLLLCFFQLHARLGHQNVGVNQAFRNLSQGNYRWKP
jgi:hypothetical protein